MCDCLKFERYMIEKMGVGVLDEWGEELYKKDLIINSKGKTTSGKLKTNCKEKEKFHLYKLFWMSIQKW